jgi:hypothetical protein
MTIKEGRERKSAYLHNVPRQDKEETYTSVDDFRVLGDRDDEERVAFDRSDCMLWYHVYKNDKDSSVSVVLAVLYRLYVSCDHMKVQTG